MQGELESALARIGWQGQSVLAAGRTDRGVHAVGQVIAFQLAWRHGPQDLTRALNANLPADIAVRQTEAAGPGFHPRFSARSRRYRYSVLVDALRDPLSERFAWRLDSLPDLDRMRSSALELLGEHDFGALGTAPVEGGHTRRTVLEAGWTQSGSRLDFELEADAFLYHMVRRITALLVAIGRAQEPPGRVRQLLQEPTVVWQGALAPACGLCLLHVRYADGPAAPATIDGQIEETQE